MTVCTDERIVSLIFKAREWIGLTAEDYFDLAAALAELQQYRKLEERLEAVMRPDCPGFDAACRALWDRESHPVLAKMGYPVDYDSQPVSIKAGLKRQVLTVLRTIAKEIKGE